jgi:hypothetical protein
MALVNGTKAIIFEVDDIGTDSLTCLSNGRFVGPDGPSDPAAPFPIVGSTVYNLRDVSLVTYFVDQTNNRLMAAYHDQKTTTFDDPATHSVVVADNIEDLQVYYFFDNETVIYDNTETDNPISTNRLQSHPIKALAFGMTSLSNYGEGPANYVRPPLFNRTEGTIKDYYRRNTLSEIIYLRNYQQ